jgi:hypothetical protein
MRTIQKNGQWGGRGDCIRVSLACVVVAQLVGNATQAISNGRVRLSLTGQEHFDQSSGFPKQVPGPQFSLQAPKFGSRTVREQPGEW